MNLAHDCMAGKPGPKWQVNINGDYGHALVYGPRRPMTARKGWFSCTQMGGLYAAARLNNGGYGYDVSVALDVLREEEDAAREREAASIHDYPKPKGTSNELH